jgi:hypothetical protein
MKMPVTELQSGMTIGMLDGVVRVASIRKENDNIVVGVSIGKLKNHPVKFDMFAQVDVFKMPDNLRGWYGV